MLLLAKHESHDLINLVDFFYNNQLYLLRTYFVLDLKYDVYILSK